MCVIIRTHTHSAPINLHLYLRHGVDERDDDDDETGDQLYGAGRHVHLYALQHQQNPSFTNYLSYDRCISAQYIAGGRAVIT